MTEDEEYAAAAVHEIHAVAESVVAKGEGLNMLLTGAGVGAALIGAAFLVLATKAHAPTPESAPTPPVIVAAPAAASTSNARPMTEREFISRPEFKSAEYQGRLIADLDGLIRFDTGTSAFALAKYDSVSGRMVPDIDATRKVARFVGDLAFCRSIPGSGLLKCWTLHQGGVIDLDQSESVKP